MALSLSGEVYRRAGHLALGKSQEVEAVGLAPAGECEREMFVMITWAHRTRAVPLAQLEAMHADKATRQALDDWHYRVEQGYEF